MPSDERIAEIRDWFVRYATIWSGFQRLMSIQFSTNPEFYQTIPGKYLNEDGVNVVHAELETNGNTCIISLDWHETKPNEVIQIKVPRWGGISFLDEESNEEH